jgi:cytochrome b6-f complex iron-sulfur subunit
MTDAADHGSPAPNPPQNRRGFLAAASQATMAGGLVASYGTLGYMACRYLYPSKPRPMAWVFVAQVPSFKLGDVLRYQTPAGQTVSITRREETGKAEDFLALSSTCPHLGCQVHWEAQNNRFFCPCHNGAFDASGKAVAGPPAEAGQSLPLYALKVENGLLFIQTPVDTLG